MSAYRAAADRLLSGGPLYADDPGAVRLGPYGQFLYPPPVALAFVPLALLPLGVAVILWTVLLEIVVVAIDIARSVVPAQLPWGRRAPVLSATSLGCEPRQHRDPDPRPVLGSLAAS